MVGISQASKSVGSTMKSLHRTHETCKRTLFWLECKAFRFEIGLASQRNPPRPTSPKLLRRLLVKNLLMPLFLMGCFPLDFHEAKRPLRTESGTRPTKAGKRPIEEAKRPIKAMVLVGISVGCLVGCFRAPQPCRKTAPQKRPIKGSMSWGTAGENRSAGGSAAAGQFQVQVCLVTERAIS